MPRSLSGWLDAALDEYESRRALGIVVSAEELCANRPDGLAALRSAIAELNAFDRVCEPEIELSPAHCEAREIGGYRLLEHLGGGGQGTVYLAERLDAPLKVALKMLHGAYPTEQRRLRFEQEKRLLAQLQHDRIAKFLDAGVADLERGPTPYLVMEYVAGQPLDAYVKEHALNLSDKLRLMRDTSEAIDFAHVQGIIHRDLKPANLLVDRFGHVKVIDFGVACLTESERRLSRRSDFAPGTLNYMSPEHLTIPSSEVDRRADIYALGVILYELTTGQSPYVEAAQHSEFSLMHAIIHDDAPSLTTVPRSVRRELEAVIRKAMCKERERRYVSARALAADLENLLAHRPIQARAPGTWYQLAKFARRNRTLVAGVTATLLALMVGLVGTLIAWRDAVASEAKAEEAFTEAWEYIETASFRPAFNAVNQTGGLTNVSAQERQLLTAMLPRGLERARVLARQQPDASTQLKLARSLLGASLVSSDEAAAETWRQEASTLVREGLVNSPQDLKLQVLRFWLGELHGPDANRPAATILSPQQLKALLEDFDMLYDLAIVSFNAANGRYQSGQPEVLAEAELQAQQATAAFRLLAEHNPAAVLNYGSGGVTLGSGAAVAQALLGRIQLARGNQEAGLASLITAAEQLKAAAMATPNDVEVAKVWCEVIDLVSRHYLAVRNTEEVGRWAHQGTQDLEQWLVANRSRAEIRRLLVTLTEYYTTAIQALADGGLWQASRDACRTKQFLCTELAAVEPDNLVHRKELLTAQANEALALAGTKDFKSAASLMRRAIADLENMDADIQRRQPLLEAELISTIGSAHLNLAAAELSQFHLAETLTAMESYGEITRTRGKKLGIVIDPDKTFMLAGLNAGCALLCSVDEQPQRARCEQAALDGLEQVINQNVVDVDLISSISEFRSLENLPRYKQLMQRLDPSWQPVHEY